MANTSELKQVEEYIRKRLNKDYPGHSFSEKPIRLLKKRNGNYATHNCDAVSEDGKIIASIKSHSWKTSGGHVPSGKIGQIYESIYFLSLAKAEVKMLIFTDEETFTGFSRLSDGKVRKDILIKYLPLPSNLQVVVKSLNKKSSDEMAF